MAWIELTEGDVLTVLAGPELQGYREAALADEQPDPVQPTIDQVTEEVRGYIEGHTSNVLGPVGTIPSRLKATALDIIAVRIPGRVGKTPKEVRKTAAEAAIKRLEAVASGRFAIGETPVETEEAPTFAANPSFHGRARRNVRGER